MKRRSLTEAEKARARVLVNLILDLTSISPVAQEIHARYEKDWPTWLRFLLDILQLRSPGKDVQALLTQMTSEGKGSAILAELDALRARCLHPYEITWKNDFWFILKCPDCRLHHDLVQLDHGDVRMFTSQDLDWSLRWQQQAWDRQTMLYGEPESVE